MNTPDPKERISVPPARFKIVKDDAFLTSVTHWEKAAVKEKRTEVAEQIRQCYMAGALELVLKDLAGISTLPPLPTQLKRLSVFRCANLRAWAAGWPGQLSYLAVADCPKLHELKSCFKSASKSGDKETPMGFALEKSKCALHFSPLAGDILKRFKFPTISSIGLEEKISGMTSCSSTSSDADSISHCI